MKANRTLTRSPPTQTPRIVIMETNLLVPCTGDRLGVQLFGEQRRGAAASDHEDEYPSKVNSGRLVG